MNTDHQTDVAELIRVLDAIRERTAQSPGCYFRHDLKYNRWSIPLRARKACLYPKPILQLGGSDPTPAVPSPGSPSR